MHVSPGTFVPFRFFARPEATELVLRSRVLNLNPANAEGRGLHRQHVALVT